MDPFQQLLNFSSLLQATSKNEEIELDQEISESLEQLRLERPKREEKGHVEASQALHKISDFREVQSYMSEYFDTSDLKAIQMRFDSALIRRDNMARKQYLLDKFREAALRYCKRRRKNNQGEPFSRFVTKKANATVIPTKTTSAVYLSKVFKYAVKKTILEHKREMGGDPWDEFFYRAYSINRENMRLEFTRDEIKSGHEEVREISPGPSARMAKLSDTLLKGETRRNPSPLMTAIVGNVPHERSEEGGKKRRLQKIDVSPICHPRFRFGKVPHSPDGRTSLTRLFYLPLLDKKSSVSS